MTEGRVKVYYKGLRRVLASEFGQTLQKLSN